MIKTTNNSVSGKYNPQITVDKNSSIPIYYQIAKAIYDDISQAPGLVNRTLPAERVFAEQLGVSRGSLRKAYQTLASEGVIEIKGKKIYIKSTTVDNGAFSEFTTPMTIGLILASDVTFYLYHKHWDTFDYISGIIDEANNLGCNINLISLPAMTETSDKVNKWFKQIETTRFSGLIYLGVRVQETDPPIDKLLSLEIPQVTVSGRFTSHATGVVSADERLGIQAGIAHLQELGHRQIAAIGLKYSRKKIFDYTGNSRLDKIESILKDEITGFDDSLVVRCEKSEESIDKAVRELIERENRPTAILAHNDDFAVKIIKSLKSLKINVPQDISVIGIDDSLQAVENSPPLTTVKKPRRKIGKEAVKMILGWRELAKGEEPPTSFVPTYLVLRNSTGEVLRK